MTESEAKQKWCHRTKRRHWFVYTWNAGRLMRCLGSDCMAWRASPLRPEDGYCGLAGRPAWVNGDRDEHP